MDGVVTMMKLYGVKNVNIKTYDKTIKELLLSGKQFTIPRFQREYSWDKKNYKEFLDDMLSCIVYEGKLKSTQYFLGTMLFVGDYIDDDSKSIDVVDGQQRLTTITILFSAIADIFKSINENILCDQIFKYIMTTNDDGEEVRILKSKSHYPFFSYYIQDKNKSNVEEPTTEEEICIKETYEFFKKNLEETSLRKHMLSYIPDKQLDKCKYVELLKVIRDQVLNTTFVSISTFDKAQANMIFEILNAKGKQLTNVDLIKNKIFEVVSDTEPADFAEERWRKIKNILMSRESEIGLATFYHHFWISKYKKSSKTKLYDDFCNIIKPKTSGRYTDFINELFDEATTYIMIVDPERSDFKNKKQYYSLVQSLNALSNTFNITQVRISLLSLFYAWKNDCVSDKSLKSCVRFLENFHFVYNCILSMPTNKLEKIYSNFAIDLRKASTKDEATEIIKELKSKLINIYPSYTEFEAQFIQLSYQKNDNPTNIKTKYAINRLWCYFANKDIFDDECSVEHIIPEAEGGMSNNIGNLIALEVELNNRADNLEFSEKLKVYSKSGYKWVSSFCEKYTDWNETLIETRAKNLAKLLYDKILIMK